MRMSLYNTVSSFMATHTYTCMYEYIVYTVVAIYMQHYYDWIHINNFKIYIYLRLLINENKTLYNDITQSRMEYL